MASNFAISRALRAGALYDEIMKHKEYSQKRMYLTTRRLVREAMECALMDEPGDYQQRRSEIFRVVNDLARGKFVLSDEPTATKGLAPSPAVTVAPVAPVKKVVQPVVPEVVEEKKWSPPQHIGEDYIETSDGYFEWVKVSP